MVVKWLLAVLILIIFISGCVGQNGDSVKPEYSDNALKLEIETSEKIEGRRILPEQTIRMIVTLTNQVENDVENVSLNISNPYGITISKVNCGCGCTFRWEEKDEHETKPCESVPDGFCTFNGCFYDKIQSLDQVEIEFSLKLPSEQEITYLGRELKPELRLEYDYYGESTLYVPILAEGEKIEEPPLEFTQTIGPIHADIESDKWVREGSYFPFYVDVKDVVNSQSKLTINETDFKVNLTHAGIDEESIGRCDFTNETTIDYFIPKNEIVLPLKNPLVCTLKADEITVPMIKTRITADYSYRYIVEKIEPIKVEKSLLGIF